MPNCATLQTTFFKLFSNHTTLIETLRQCFHLVFISTAQTDRWQSVRWNGSQVCPVIMRHGCVLHPGTNGIMWFDCVIHVFLCDWRTSALGRWKWSVGIRVLLMLVRLSLCWISTNRRPLRWWLSNGSDFIRFQRRMPHTGSRSPAGGYYRAFVAGLQCWDSSHAGENHMQTLVCVQDEQSCALMGRHAFWHRQNTEILMM